MSTSEVLFGIFHVLGFLHEILILLVDLLENLNLLFCSRCLAKSDKMKAWAIRVVSLWQVGVSVRQWHRVATLGL